MAMGKPKGAADFLRELIGMECQVLLHHSEPTQSIRIHVTRTGDHQVSGVTKFVTYVALGASDDSAPLVDALADIIRILENSDRHPKVTTEIIRR